MRVSSCVVVLAGGEKCGSKSTILMGRHDIIGQGLSSGNISPNSGTQHRQSIYPVYIIRGPA
jgi:hypothetical protein